MARPADPRKFQAWQRRLKRHATSGLSVARFCSRERVSVTTFQYWRQRCSRTAPEPSALTSPSVFSPVEFLSHRGVTIRFAAGAVMSSLPIVILFVSLQKYITNGLTGGAVKG